MAGIRKRVQQRYPDLFETLAEGISCDYISDLRLNSNREKIRQYFLHFNTDEQYGLRQWEDLADYLLRKKTSFCSEKEALCWIRERI